MERLFTAIEQFFDRVLTRETLTEVAAAFAAFGIAWLLGRLLSTCQPRREPGVALSLRDRALEGAVLISPFVIATLLLFVTRSVLDAVDLHTGFMDLMVKLMTALVLIRISVFLLRLSLGPGTWLRAWES